MTVINPQEVESIPGAEGGSPAEKRLEILSFMLESEEYGVDIMSIREIIRPVPITIVPRVPDYILGIVSLRGRIIPVYDLRNRLKLTPVDRPRKPRYIVLTTKFGLVGMVADTVTGVVRIPESAVDPPPSVINGEEGEFIRGLAKDGDRLIILLNAERIFTIGSGTHSNGRERGVQP